MRRMISVLLVAALIVVLMASSALPALALDRVDLEPSSYEQDQIDWALAAYCQPFIYIEKDKGILEYYPCL